MVNQSQLLSEAEFWDRAASAIVIDGACLRRYSQCEGPSSATEFSPRMKQDILKVVGNPAGKRVLVYGAGTDAAPCWFAAKGAVVDAIDISSISIDVQKTVAARLNLQVNAVVADAHQTGLPAEHYDLVYGNAILHHLDLPRATAEIWRLLKPDGLAVFRDVMAGNAGLRLFRKLTPNWRTNDEHPLVERDIEAFCAVFPRVRAQTYCLSALPYLGALRLTNRLLHRLFRFHLPVLKPLVWLFDGVDRVLLGSIPPLRTQAWMCVLELRKAGQPCQPCYQEGTAYCRQILNA